MTFKHEERSRTKGTLNIDGICAVKTVFWTSETCLLDRCRAVETKTERTRLALSIADLEEAFALETTLLSTDLAIGITDLPNYSEVSESPIGVSEDGEVEVR